jgi:hypothetical protein
MDIYEFELTPDKIDAIKQIILKIPLKEWSLRSSQSKDKKTDTFSYSFEPSEFIYVRYSYKYGNLSNRPILEDIIVYYKYFPLFSWMECTLREDFEKKQKEKDINEINNFIDRYYKKGD